jgi:hypothetical protein
MTKEEKQETPDSSHLFTVRVWVEQLNSEERQVRIQVKHVLSGAMRTFIRWPKAIAFIMAQIEENLAK